MTRRRKWQFSMLSLLLVLGGGIAMCALFQPAVGSGDIRIAREELAFYVGVVRLHSGGTEEELLENAKQYAQQVYGKAAIAIEYNVIDEFSFQGIIDECAQKNAKNKQKLADGEPVMGLVEYSPEQYFEFYLSSLENKTIEKIASSPDAALVEEAGVYYEQNKEHFLKDVLVEYSFTPFEYPENKYEQTLAYQQLKTIYSVDEELYDRLLNGTVGQQLLKSDGIVFISKRKKEYFNLESDRQVILEKLLSSGKYDELVNQKAESVTLVYEP